MFNSISHALTVVRKEYNVLILTDGKKKFLRMPSVPKGWIFDGLRGKAMLYLNYKGRVCYIRSSGDSLFYTVFY